MTKYLLAGLLAAALAIVAFTFMPVAMAAGDCSRKEFKTELVKAACKKGGQSEAKKEMKGFLKKCKAKDVDGVKNCKSCHDELKPDYPLSKDGLTKFKACGGSVIAAE